MMGSDGFAARLQCGQVNRPVGGDIRTESRKKEIEMSSITIQFSDEADRGMLVDLLAGG